MNAIEKNMRASNIKYFYKITLMSYKNANKTQKLLTKSRN